MSNTFKAGTLLVNKTSGTAFLVQETFVITKTYENKKLWAVGSMALKVVRIDLSTLYSDFDVVVPDET